MANYMSYYAMQSMDQGPCAHQTSPKSDTINSSIVAISILSFLLVVEFFSILLLVWFI